MTDELNCPNVSGFLLYEAEEVINNAGFAINRIIETSPPKEIKGSIQDSYRVIRLMQINDKSCDLLVCRPL